MASRNTIGRRPFLKHASVVAAGVALPMVVPSSVPGDKNRAAPSKRINMGFVGVGIRGIDVMRSFLYF